MACPSLAVDKPGEPSPGELSARPDDGSAVVARANSADLSRRHHTFEFTEGQSLHAPRIAG